MKNKASYVKWMSVLIACLFMLLFILQIPLVAAQSEQNLQFKKIGQALENFIYKVRLAITVSDDGKLELIRARNEQLRERQQEWIQIKADAEISEKITAEEKQAVLAEIQEAHEAIINSHVAATEDAQKIAARASENGDMAVALKAKVVADAVARSEVGFGLEFPHRGNANKTTEERTEPLTGAEAAAIAKKELGIPADQIITTTINDRTYYIVSGHEADINGTARVNKSYEVKIDALTGGITGADISVKSTST